MLDGVAGAFTTRCWMPPLLVAKEYIFLKKINLFIYLFIFGCVGSSFLCEGFLQLRRAGATPHCSAQASHCRGLSCCRAQAPDAQAQQLWLTGPVAPRHVGSSQTRARTRVPRIGRQTPNHCATREAQEYILKRPVLQTQHFWEEVSTARAWGQGVLPFSFQGGCVGRVCFPARFSPWSIPQSQHVGHMQGAEGDKSPCVSLLGLP